MPSLLITGGAGFIGSNFAKTSIRRGWKVRILDNLSTGLQRLANVLKYTRFGTCRKGINLQNNQPIRPDMDASLDGGNWRYCSKFHLAIDLVKYSFQEGNNRSTKKDLVSNILKVLGLLIQVEDVEQPIRHEWPWEVDGV